jgi:dTDP-4-amino-4,6-dideoxygalactose transaminase
MSRHAGVERTRAAEGQCGERAVEKTEGSHCSLAATQLPTQERDRAATTWRVPLADLNYDQEEEEAVLRVIRSGWLTMGPVTADFEVEFARFVRAKHAVAVSNCTQALHLACRALGVGPGDEVIVPSLSFVATANAVLYTGADVRFADIISPLEPTISPQAIEAQINSATKAIMVMHYAGYPCQMPAICQIAQRHGLQVIEDCAHAPGANRDGRPLGSWGDVGCFSFFSNKNLCTGEGGMLVTNRDDIAQQARLARSHGMTTLTWQRHAGHAFSYDVVDLGYNYRIDEIRSVLGLVQLRKLASANARRRAITDHYRRLLAVLPVELPLQHVPGESACHLLPVLLPESCDRRQVMESLRERGIQTSIHYPPIHEFGFYKNRYPSMSLPQTELASRRLLTLPLYPGMNDGDVELVVTELSGALGS